jgi:hypothetical protein
MGNLRRLISTDRICLTTNEVCVSAEDIVSLLKTLYPNLCSVLEDTVIIYRGIALSRDVRVCEASDDIFLTPLMSGGGDLVVKEKILVLGYFG